MTSSYDAPWIPRGEAGVPACDTLVDLLQWRAEAHPRNPLFSFSGAGDSPREVTYERFHAAALKIACDIAARTKTGDRVLLLHTPGIDYIAAFFGCMLAGTLPVPCSPPTNRRNSERAAGILRDCAPTLILTSPGEADRLRRIVAFDAWLETGADLTADATSIDIERRPAGEVAFLQYTSGSTSAPKGVIVTQGGLLANLEQIRRAFRLTPRSIVAHWLPPYHDMGLIGGLLQIIYSGASAFVLPPTDFLRLPIRWLRAISDTHATHAGAPNFAYDLCATRVTDAQKEGLDLSSWKVAFCGAEPVRAETLERFYEAFESCGFRREALLPCYGLAEATLLVSAAEYGEGPTISQNGSSDSGRVSCGRPVRQTVAIVDPATEKKMPDGEIGEIWVAGENVAGGYWNDPAASAATFGATIADAPDSAPFLRTGDLGWLNRGQLHVAGRIKDLIVLRGRNIYPQDVEAAACGSHPALRGDGAAAFSLTGSDGECLAILQELDFRRQASAELFGHIRAAVFDATGAQPNIVALLKPGALPRTSSGKIQRARARQAFLDGGLAVLIQEARHPEPPQDALAPSTARLPSPEGFAPSADAIEAWLKEAIGEKLGLDSRAIDGAQAFASHGLDSLLAVELVDALSHWLRRPLAATLPWEYPSPRRLAEFLAAPRAETDTPAIHATEESSPLSQPPEGPSQCAASDAIAIIGVGCRFPSAQGPEAFWQLLVSETDAVRAVPAQRYAAQSYQHSSGAPEHTRVGGFLDEIDTFDPHFFGISPHEARQIDPQQRLLLEVAWEALEDAAIAPANLAGSATGVYVGISSRDYEHLLSSGAALDLYTATGAAPSIAPNRLSYLLDLQGPSIAVDSACSSSLVAVHLACQALRSGEAALALAGGVNLLLSDRTSVPFAAAGLLSESGRCKTFDAAADGYVRGEGCGVVVLKKLDDALRDGDPVHAVIAATAVRQDGRSNGLVAPNGAAQTSVIRDALTKAGVAPRQISYVEAHGTGTALGDPIELNALKEALLPGRRAEQICLIGSVKSNIGHLEAAAGIAGLIKTVLALQKRTIPANLHYSTPNPRCALDGTTLAIASARQAWRTQSAPRYAGVSAFGFGGTIAHAVLTEAPPHETPSDIEGAPCHLLCLSAKSAAALDMTSRRLAQALAVQDGPPLADFAYTLQTGRNAFDHRRALVAANASEAVRMLAETAEPPSCSAAGRIVFMFPDESALHEGAAHPLYRHLAAYREHVDACLALLEPGVREALRQLLHPKSAADSPRRVSPVERSPLAQPATFIVSYALAQLWLQSGIRPQAMIGRGVGEYVASCLAGVFSLEAALSLVTLRGRLMQYAAERDAVDGSPAEALDARGAGEIFLQALHAIPRQAPSIPYVSSLSGTWIGAREATSPEYWARHLHGSACFADGLSTLAATKDSILLEVGPGQDLSRLARGRAACPEMTVLPTLSAVGAAPPTAAHGDLQTLMHALGALWQAGFALNWAAINRGNRAKRVAVPPTQFERQRYWLDRPDSNLLPIQADMNRPLATGQSAAPNNASSEKRRAAIEAQLCVLIAGVLQVPAERINASAQLLDLGADSLMLMQAVRSIEGMFGITLTVDQLFEKLTTIADIAAFLDQALPAARHVGTAAEQPHPPHPPRSPSMPSMPSMPPMPLTADASSSTPALPAMNPSPLSSGELRDIIAQQLQIMSQQLTVMNHALRLTSASQPAVSPAHAAAVPPSRPTDESRSDNVSPAQAGNARPLSVSETADLSRHDANARKIGAGDHGARPSVREQSRADRSPEPPRASTALRPRPRGADSVRIPLSFSQQRLWFLHQFDPGSPQYNVPVTLRLLGKLALDKLERAINMLIARHEILRTTFHDNRGHPVQVVHEALPLTVKLTDLSSLPAVERTTQAATLARREVSLPFDLTAGPMLRVHLLRIDDSEHVGLLTVHHIVADGWSSNILLHELSVVYSALLNDEIRMLPPLPIQYADYALWQREHLRGAGLEKQLGFWTAYLADAPALLELPYDRPRPARQTYHGGVLTRQLNAVSAQGIGPFSRRHAATPYMVLLATFSLLLSRYSGRDDIVVGSPIANRHHADLDSVIGMFANTLALRNKIAVSDSFADLLAQVRTNMLKAYVHQDVPFEYVVDALKPERSTSYAPIFQVMLSLQNTPKRELHSGGLTIRQEPNPGQIAKFDLTVDLTETAEGLQTEWEYNADLFDQASIERMAGHFEQLLEQVMQAPERKLAELSLPTRTERESMLSAWNATATSYPERTLTQLFEAQAEKTPERIAVRCAHTQLAYAELNARANRLAHRLIELGVGPDVLVGICLERNCDMLVALLAVIKAGGAYVPLDPAYPRERLSLILDDARPALLVSTSEALDRLPEQANVILLDRARAESDYAERNPPVRADGAHLAYVIYTSGSTGRPKGIGIGHASLANFLQSMQQRPGMAQQDVLLAVTSISFDIAALELWLPLITGAEVVIASRDACADPERLRQLIEHHRVTVMQATPATWQMLVSHGWPEQTFTALCGGEALPCALSKALLDHTQRVWNLYGPTETTIWSALHCITTDTSRIAIGTAIGNTQLYVLDKAGQPAPIGVVGELHIGGAGLARGYLRNPGATAERFVPNPFGPPGSRMYRTGDLARWLPDGTVECMGRLDHQIKLRGFRIELSEIEAALIKQPQIREAVAAAIDSPSGRQLIAYAVPELGAALDPTAVRALLQTALPDYMVPAHIVPIARLPLTPNGKIDRRALPTPDAVALNQPKHLAPASAMEVAVASIWSELLGLPVERIGLHDNFFALGGHSLLATQVVVRVRETLGLTLGLRALFDHATLASLAGHLDRQAPASKPSEPAVAARRATLPASYMQERLWFVRQFDPRQTAYNMPYALRMRGALSVPALRHAFDALIARHESLRTTFASDEHGQPLQVIASRQAADLPIVEATDESVEQHAERHAQHVFDLERGPLLKTTLLRIGPDHHVLLVNVHHIVSDGWSTTIMIRDMQQLYAAAVEKTVPALARLPIQYADFSSWQRQQDLSPHLAYWQDALAGYDPGLPLPYDRQPTGKAWPAGAIAHRYPERMAAELMRFSLEQGVTLFMTLVTALLIVLHRYTQRTDLCVGTTVAGRDVAHVDQLVGFFVNILALRVDLRGNPDGLTLLQRVKETALHGYEHQALPFEHLQNTLPHTRGDRSNALVPVIVRHQNFPAPSSSSWAGDLAVESLPCGDRMAKCELDFQFTGDGAQLEVLLEYASTLFDAATVERLLQHHQSVLQEWLDQPRRRLSDFTVLTQDESMQVGQCNRTEHAWDTSVGVAVLFDRRVAAHPERLACFDSDVSLTYAALNARANQLAHALRARGVDQGSRVGLCLPRGNAFLAALIAIFKAGGVYVPIDAKAPQSYRQLLLDDAALTVAITSRALTDCLPGIDALCIDDDLSAWPDTSLSASAHPDDTACLLYTSGSTGRPKGVLVPHRQLLNLLHSLWRTLPFGEDEVVAQKTPASYAVSLKELLGSLLAGVPQVSIDDERVKDLEAFAKRLRQAKVTRLYIVPSHLQALLDALEALDAPDAGTHLAMLRCCVTAGEPLPQTLRSRVRKQLPWVDLWNNFGCTELNDMSYCTPAAQEQPLAAAAAFVPIGMPIRNVKLYVLDDMLAALPTGVAGELYASHAGAPTGYWRRPSLTAERFVPDPFADTPGARLYRTGDIVRRLSDGTLEYLGRADFEVKVRGHRIDVRQVELTLTEFPGIRQAVVTARQQPAGSAQLVAFCVPRGAQQAIDVAALRAHLAQRLPSHMVPSSYITLEALPSLPNGKLDRKALLAPSAQAHTLARLPYAEPTIDTERALVDIWAALLEVPAGQIGIHDNFFALGGHSLLATQVLSRVRRSFGVELPLEKLFDNPTIAAVAEHIDTLKWVAAGNDEWDIDDTTAEFTL